MAARVGMTSGHAALRDAFESALASGHPGHIAFLADELAQQLGPSESAPLLWRALVVIGPDPQHAVERNRIAEQAYRAYVLAGDVDGQWRVGIRLIFAGHELWWTMLYRAMGRAMADGDDTRAWQVAFEALIRLYDAGPLPPWDAADGVLAGARSGYC